MVRPIIIAALAFLTLPAGCGPAPGDPAGLTTTADSLLPEDRLELPAFGIAEYRALLRELRGMPVVVNIWGSWCPPCRVEAPDLGKVARELEDEVQFVGVDILDDRGSAREFILEFDWPYPSLFDPDGEIRDGLGYVGQPITIVYDRDGRVAFEWVGNVTAELLREEIEKVL